MRAINTVLLFTIAGCEGSEISEGQTQQAVAMVQADSTFTVAFAMSEYKARLSEVLAGGQPTDFRWVKVTVESPRSQDVISEQGFNGQLVDVASKVTFSQVYQSPCNPATEDNRSCFIHESYSAGEAGLTGTITLRATPTHVNGSFDVSWEGDTDRFGEPRQWLQITTHAGYSAPKVTP